MEQKIFKNNFIVFFLLSSDAYAGSNTGGLFNNLVWSLIAVFLIYEFVKGDKKRIVGVTVYSLVVISIGFFSPLYSGIAVLFTPIVALMVGGYFLREKEISPDSELEIQEDAHKEVTEIKLPDSERLEEDKYLRESREALERIKKNPSIVLSNISKKTNDDQKIPPHTKEVEYLLDGIPHKWDGNKFIKVHQERD
jgi:hypothetical protein